MKLQLGVTVQDVGREQVVLENFARAKDGPLSDEAVHEIYQVIMVAMRDLQREP